MKFLFIFSCLSLGLWAETEIELSLKKATQMQAISLQNAVNLAQVSNFEFQRVQARLIQAQSKVWLQTSQLLPSLSFGAHRELKQEPHTTKANFMLSVPLVDTKNILASKASYESLKAARLNSYFAREKLIYHVAYLYAEALKAQAERDLAKEEQEKFLKYEQMIERKVKIGSARSLDLTSAMYQSNKAASDFLLKERDYQNNLAKLGSFIGLTETFEITMFEVHSQSLALSSELLVNLAQKTTEIGAIKRELASSKYNLTSESFSFLPTLKASTEPTWSWSSEGRNFSNQIMLNLEFALFNGGASIAHMRHHRAEITINELNLREKEREKHLSVLGSLDRITTLKKSKASSELALIAAQQAADSAERLYAQGALTTLDLKDASFQLFSAKRDLFEATLNLIQSQLSLLLLVGKMGDLVV